MLALQLGWCVGISIHEGDLTRQASRGSQQEMTAAASWIDDLEPEQCGTPVIRVIGCGLANHGLERRFDEFVDQTRRCVVGPGELALAALGGVAVEADITVGPGITAEPP